MSVTRLRTQPLPIARLAVICVAFLMQFAEVQAQFRLDIEDVAETIVPIAEATPPKREELDRRVVMVNENINGLLFHRHSNEGQARRSLARQLSLAIDAIDRDVGLTEDQRRKLQLAGAGDVSIFFAEVEKLRDEFGEKMLQNPNGINNIWQDIQPLRQRLQNSLFGPGSIFAKVAEGLFDELQLNKLQKVEQQRLRFFFETHLKRTICQLERRQPMHAKQRREVMKLLEEVEMPSRGTRQMTNNYVSYSLWKLRPQLSEILNGRQLAALDPLVRHGVDMEKTLREAGYLP